MKKYISLIIRAILTVVVFALGFLVLHKFEYLTEFNQIDNVVGMLTVLFAFIFAAGIAYLLWTRYSRQNAALNITVAVLVVASVALFPLALRGNWWINPTTSDMVQAAPDLTVYAPFSQNSKAAKLAEKSSLQLAGDLPILDGATALYPLYAAFAQAAYDEAAYSPEKVICTNTGNAYKAIVTGECDIAFVATASEKQIEAAKNIGVELKFTPIGREAFVFLTGKENPISDVSYQQLRNIYSGKTSYWRTLGWGEGGKIIAFQRPEGSGSQTGLQGIMNDIPIQVPQPLPDKGLIGTNSLMKQVSVEWNGVQPALGYSYRYYATTMYANHDVKLLSVDGIAPTEENIQNGKYPFVGDFYAVTNGEPVGNTKSLIDWILSPQGQELVSKTGYTPLSGK